MRFLASKFLPLQNIVQGVGLKRVVGKFVSDSHDPCGGGIQILDFMLTENEWLDSRVHAKI